MKIQNILNYNDELEKFGDKKLPIKISFIIAKNKNKIEQIVSLFQEQRLILINRYAKKDKNNQIITDEKGYAKIENFKEFIKEYKTLLESDQNIELDPISYSDLKQCGNGFFDILTPKELSILSQIMTIKE